jgi:hypothetical protein
MSPVPPRSRPQSRPLASQPGESTLYTFISDHPGQVTGQGVQNFFVATPGLVPIAATAAPAGPAPAAPAGGYGY